MRARIKTKAFGETDAVINVSDWSAFVGDDENDIGFWLEYGTYEFLEWIESEPDAAPPCTCDIALTWACVCGHVTPYKAPR